MSSQTSALFDAPGPVARSRIRMITLVSLVLIALLIFVAIRQFWVNGQLEPAKWEQFLNPGIQWYLVKALGNTLLAAAGAAAIALPLGLVLALGRLSKNRGVRWSSTIIIEMFRAIPLLLLIYIFFIALPQYGINPDLFWKLVIPIGLCAGASIAEVFRAGILALPKGQSEGALSLGLSEAQTFWNVIFPQAVRMVVPSLLAQVVILLKDTTLGYVVSYGELQNSAKVLVASSGNLIQTYLIVTLVYIAINVLISKSAERIDRRFQRRRAGAGLQAQAVTLQAQL
ncbi:MAG: amino acid ABC transporter permease [Microbacteriaceae bacterium]